MSVPIIGNAGRNPDLPPNVYTAPEQFRLKLVGTVDWIGAEFAAAILADPEHCGAEYDMIGVWHDMTENRLFVGDCLGCGCELSGPFDGMGREDLQELEVTDWEALDEFLIGVFDHRLAVGEIDLTQVTRIASEIGAVCERVRSIQRPR